MGTTSFISVYDFNLENKLKKFKFNLIFALSTHPKQRLALLAGKA